VGPWGFGGIEGGRVRLRGGLGEEAW